MASFDEIGFSCVFLWFFFEGWVNIKYERKQTQFIPGFYQMHLENIIAQ